MQHKIITESHPISNPTRTSKIQRHQHKLQVYYSPNIIKGKGKGKVHPRTGHEGPEGVQMYSSTLPSTSALDGGG